MARIVAISIAFAAAGTVACFAGEGYPRGELLVEPAELAKEAGSFAVLDSRPRAAYEAGHVRGAVWIDHAAWEKAFHADEGRGVEAWRGRIAALGVTNDTPVVIYDDNLSKDAARVWWILKFFGVKDVRLLNGGWKGWTAGGFHVSTEEAKPAPSDFAPVPASNRLRQKSDLLKSLKEGDKVQIIDARSEAEHCGDEPLKNAKGGAIPGSKSLEWSDLLDKQTGRFKSAEELNRLFAAAGIDPKRPTVTHCQSGGRASVMAFGLELMGADEVANYYRGWSEWGNSEETPVEKTGKPGGPDSSR